MDELLPPDVRKEILESKDRAIQYANSMSRLTQSRDWMFLEKCLKFYREELIKRMKISGKTADEFLQKLIAVDMLLDLPKDIRTAIGATDDAVTPGKDDTFGFVKDDNPQATTLQESKK